MNDHASFNVLWDPWIPVETIKGEIVYMGIHEALFKAHDLRGVCAESPLFSYGIQRILIAFLIDAYRPEVVDELAELIGKGCFDADTLDKYITKCNAEGERFDLFDTQHPFMQTAFIENKETDVAVKLFAEWPEGNNHVHFNHTKEDNHKFTPGECACALCAMPAFAMNFGRSTSFGINGMPPVYFLHAGRDLFETLACSMIVRSELTVPLDDPPVAWRSNQTVQVGEPLVKVSLLHGLTCQPRRIQLVPEKVNDEIFICRMMYDKGWDYKLTPNWRDPHVCYYWDEKEIQKPLRPREGRAVWRDLGNIMPRKSQATIINKMEDKFINMSDAPVFVSFHAYALVGKIKGAVYAVMSWFEEPLPMHLHLLQSEEKTQFLLDCLQIMEDINRALSRTISQSLEQLQGEKGIKNAHGPYVQLVEQGQILFLSATRNYIMGELIILLDAAPLRIDWSNPMKIDVGARFQRIAMDALEGICATLSTSAKALEWRAVAQNVLARRIYGCLKGGWMDERTKTGTKKA